MTSCWRAWTTPELMKRWWAPKPYETPEVEMDLRPGGRFSIRMTGPDGFDFQSEGCFLEVAERSRIVWTDVLRAGYRPAGEIQDCGGLPFTAVLTFEDNGDGRTRYRAVAMHRNPADVEKHVEMGFMEGWGTCADQLGEVARELGEKV
jgi:uncharacterized protein YndB with AHSA1/START domain